jgi:hypothetical protein
LIGNAQMELARYCVSGLAMQVVWRGGCASVLICSPSLVYLRRCRAHFQVRHAVDSMTSGWLTAAAQLLQGAIEEGEEAVRRASDGAVGQGTPRTVHHCVVTTGQLVATLGKLVLFGLDRWFPADCVYR